MKDHLNRLCIFAHYDRDNIVDDYVYFYLKSLKPVCKKIVFVTTSVLKETAKNDLKKYSDSMIIRENRGYDFMSWRIGLDSEALEDYDEILLCNDSVYGPLFPLEEAFGFMSTKDCDFWGMTESRQISYHLQSYFLVFRKPVILSPAFQAFWKDITIQKSKNALIRSYEVGLSSVLMKAGFKADAYVGYTPSIISRFRLMLYLCSSKIARMTASVSACKSKTKSDFGDEAARTALSVFPYKLSEKVKSILKGENFNVTHLLWKELIVQQRMPFLKVELLRDNPMAVNIHDFERIIASCSDYDTNYITSHLERMSK